MEVATLYLCRYPFVYVLHWAIFYAIVLSVRVCYSVASFCVSTCVPYRRLYGAVQAVLLAQVWRKSLPWVADLIISHSSAHIFSLFDTVHIHQHMTKYVLTIVCTMYNVYPCECAAACAHVEGERFRWTTIILLNPHHGCYIQSLDHNIYQRNTLLLFFPEVGTCQVCC